MAPTASRLFPTSALVIAFFVLSLAMPGPSGLSALATHGGEAATITLSGTLTDQETDLPLENVTVLVHNEWAHKDEPSDEDGEVRYIQEPERGHETYEAQTDAEGQFSVDLHPGWVRVEIAHPGYQHVTAWSEVQGNQTLDLAMRPSSEEGATVQGQITSTDGQPLEGVHISVHRDHRVRCDGDVCYAEASASSSATEAGHGSWQINYEPQVREYASTETGADGTYSLTVAPGPVQLNAWARDHMGGQDRFNVSQGETRTVDLTLRAIPANTVTVTGTVLDAESGEPIPHAWVNAENHRWGDWQSTQTDEAGVYTLELKPGYTTLNVHAERSYWVPCEEHHATDEAGTEASEAKPEPATSDEDAVSASTMIAPRQACESQEREHAYLPQVHTIVPAQGQAMTWSPQLERAPGPDATFQGWVINATTEQGIPDAHVSFYNEETREWGQATTDADGSFKIDVRHGYYTIRTWANDYFPGAVNTRIAAGATETITLELTGGQTSYGGCCYDIMPAMSREGVAMDRAGGDDGAQEASTSGLSEIRAQPSGDQDASTREEGSQAFEGEAGGLGPYDASKASVPGGPGASNEAPSVGLVAMLAIVSLGALGLRLRSRG